MGDCGWVIAAWYFIFTYFTISFLCICCIFKNGLRFGMDEKNIGLFIFASDNDDLQEVHSVPLIHPLLLYILHF